MVLKIKDIANNLFRNKSYIVSKYSRIFLAFVLIVAGVFSVYLTGKSINTFKIFDGNTTKIVRLMSNDIDNAIKYANIDSSDYEILSTSSKNGLINIKIGYSFPVYIISGDKTVKVKTTARTVANILKIAGFNVDDYDLIEPTADTVIDEETIINYDDVEFVSGSYTEAIPCSLDTVYSSEKVKGENTVIQGTDGEKQVYYTSKTVNGTAVETVVDNVVVLSDAVNGKQIIGTAVPKAAAVKTSEQVSSISTLTPSSPIELDANGNPVNYSKKLTVQATGYTYTGHRCATGVNPQPGYIAVNPKVIPYGTKMYIKSTDGKYVYGYAVAADTGGFVRSRPNNVDLFFATRSACNMFGRRNVEIYIIG